MSARSLGARALGAAVALPVVAVVLVAFAPPAHALVVPESAYVTINDIGGLEACGDGAADSRVNNWVFTVEGARSDGTKFLTTVTGDDRGFHACVPILMGTAAGGGTATLTYAGVGPDVAVSFVGYFAWTPTTGPFGAGSGVKPA